MAPMNFHDFDDLVLPAVGRPDPLANGLKTGTEADCPRVPEDAAAVIARAGSWYLGLKPQNLYHAWLVDQVAITSLGIDRLGRIERRLRDRVVLRAELFWDEDRKLEAEELGEKLAHSPPKVVNLLRRTPQGCDWMIGRWARLARIADVDQKWDDAQRSLAFDLLGARPEDRAGRPGETIDREGRPVASPDGLAELARREVAGLLGRKAEVAPLDALDRTMARSDYVDLPTPEIRDLRRQDATLHRRLKWYLSQIAFRSKEGWTDGGVYKYFLRDVAPEPTADPTPQPAEAKAEEIDPSPEPAPGAEEDAMILPDRRQAKLNKAEARRDARRRKLERLRA